MSFTFTLPDDYIERHRGDLAVIFYVGCAVCGSEPSLIPDAPDYRVAIAQLVRLGWHNLPAQGGWHCPECVAVATVVP